jgi:Parvulin-like peptidyl-prolyl isomerase
MKRIANELAQTNDDSAYAVANSDNPNAFRKYYAGNLPSYVSRDDLREGNVIGPFLDGDVYRVIKVSKVFKDTVFSARAKHILIKPDDETPAAKNAAKEKARKILKEIRDGADFAAKALEHGTDGTRTNGGDLGWFTSGQMVKPFEDAVFKATRPGLLSDVVETQFGYHIIEVTNTKDNSAVNLAEVEIPITPSDATTNDVYRKAEAFLSGVSNEKEFIDKAGKEGLTVLEGKNITSNDMRIGILDDSREIVRWLFLDGSVGKVSNIFDLHGEFVVAVMTDEREDGYLPLEAVRDEIAAEALQKPRAEPSSRNSPD